MNRLFNLISEPWIIVRTADCQTKEVSLKDALLSAHEFKGLAGETKAQDFAVFRLMLSVLYTVFSRCDAEGNAHEPENSLLTKNWKQIWSAGRMPRKPIEQYFDKWKDRFWLFDDNYPFYQSPAITEKGNPYQTSKMIGTLVESANKVRLFTDRTASDRELTFAEATRWLINVVNFDDKAAKNKKMQVPKRTWASELSLIAVLGDNLFETLMLNYCARTDSPIESLEQHPIWEDTKKCQGTDVYLSEQNALPIRIPNNQAELLTLKSRQIFLIRHDEKVTGYYVQGGMYFDSPAYIERMTLWDSYQKKETETIQLSPKKFTNSNYIWQEFENIALLDPKEGESGVLKWIRWLIKKGYLAKSFFIRLSTAAVIYKESDGKSLPVIDCVSDTLTFHAKLLEDAGRYWREDIIEEIGKAEQAADNVYNLYKDLQFAAGRRDKKDKKDGKKEQSGETDAKREYYARIDRVFRLWLERLDPDADRTAYKQELEAALFRIAAAYGGELAGQVGGGAVFGRVTGDGTVSAAEALNRFIGKLYQLFTLAKTDRTGGEQGEQK